MKTLDLGNGYAATIRIECDDAMGAPWDEHDGHGVVSDWTTRAKAPGERVLCEDRESKRYYDVQASIAIALKDGWDAPPYGKGTKREQAARAVNADFARLRAWCNGEWYWVGVLVEVTRGDTVIGNDSLWGIDDEAYAMQEGEQMARHIADEHYNKLMEAIAFT